MASALRPAWLSARPSSRQDGGVRRRGVRALRHLDQGLVRSIDRHERLAEIQPNHGRGRRQRFGTLECRDRELGLAGFQAGIAEIVPRVGAAGIDLEGPLVGQDAIVEPALRLADVADHAAELRVRRRRRGSARSHLLGRRRIPAIQERLGEIDAQAGIGRIALERLAQQLSPHVRDRRSGSR